MYEEITIKKGKPITQDLNIPFLSSLEMGIQNPSMYSTERQRIQEWNLNDDVIIPFKEVLREEVEKKLNNIDSGAEKLTQYSNAKEYLKHIDDVLNE